MASIEKSILIEYSALQMFELVDRVEDYPLFLPWCGSTRVEFRDELKTIATLNVDYLGVKSHFTTENDKLCPSRISLRLVDGPFRRLDGAWRFKSLAENACKVEFELSYEFSSKVFERIIGPVFNQINNVYMDAFVRRAQVVYGEVHG